MPLYRYRAASQEGRVHQGQIEAMHELDLETQLKRMGLLLLRARLLTGRAQVKRLTRRDLINLLFQLEMLVRAGVPILGALGDLREAGESAAGRDLSGGLCEKVEGGATLAQALSAFPGVFSEATVNLVRAGEVSGQLPEVLWQVVRSLKWQDELATQTKTLLLYPSFVIVVIGGVVFFLMLYLVPQLTGFLTSMGQEIPWPTRTLIAVSGFFLRHGWAMLLGPALLVMGLPALATVSPDLRYRLHQAALAAPYIGPILKKMMLARFADTFALMYRTGVPLIEALACCQKISANLVFQQALVRVRERVSNGVALSESFAAEALFPALLIRMLRVGESSGALESALSNISYFYTRDIDAAVAKVQAMLEPALTVLLGLVLGWIMVAVLSPVYDTLARLKI
jgi:type IV pilus assembly protein PilC